MSWLKAVEQNGWALKFCSVQTKEICLAAVKQNGLALEYCLVQDEEICLVAVKQNGLALKYVDKQFVDIYTYCKLLYS